MLVVLQNSKSLLNRAKARVSPHLLTDALHEVAFAKASNKSGLPEKVSKWSFAP